LRFFDLHCDSLTECYQQGVPFEDFSGHISLRKGRIFKRWAQVFAIFVPDRLRGAAAADYLRRVLEFYHTRCAAALARNGCAALLALENGCALCGDPSQVDFLAQSRIRMASLTWNGENELGSGADCDPKRGLKPAGKETVRRLFAAGILPDVSHLNEAGFWDVAALWAAQPATRRLPFLASHSNCAAIQPHRRNLDDAQLRAIFAAGGLVGVNLYPAFLGGAGTADAVFRHISQLLALGGARHLALGSDFDGASLHKSLAGMEKMPALNQALACLGLDEATREALFWGNAARVLGNPAL
jgi:membrane dipeptidase